MTQRIFGRAPSPLEVADTALNSVAEVVQLPFRAASQVGGAATRAADGVKRAIDVPKDYAEIPAPPDVVVEGGFNALTSVANGVVEGIGGVLDAARDTGEGIVGQFRSLTR